MILEVCHDYTVSLKSQVENLDKQNLVKMIVQRHQGEIVLQLKDLLNPSGVDYHLISAKIATKQLFLSMKEV